MSMAQIMLDTFSSPDVIEYLMMIFAEPGYSCKDKTCVPDLTEFMMCGTGLGVLLQGNDF